MVSGEPDFQKRIKALTDLWYIKGVLLQDPTVAACVPISVENTALAYNAATDRFKVDIEAMTVGAIETTIANDWTRELGQVDLARVLGAALAHDNPVIARLTDGSAFIDPRDVSDRAARELGVVYGSLDKLQQQTTTKELLVQISHQGAIKDPTQIRTLTSTDVVKAYGSQTQALLQRASTYDLIVQLRHNGAEIDPTQIRGLTTSDKVSVEQSDETKLKATVTQASAVRTISSIDATATAVQINITGLNGNSSALVTPANGKAIRIKFISLEHSAAVDIGYRFGATGTIYYLRTTAGVYVSNLIGCNNQGAANAVLYLNSSGATNVKGYILYQEV